MNTSGLSYRIAIWTPLSTGVDKVSGYRPRALKPSRRCWQLACGTVAVCLGLGLATAINAAQCERWNTEWLWTTASSMDVQACLDIGADPNARDSEGRTPLHWAAWSKGPRRVTPMPSIFPFNRLRHPDLRDDTSMSEAESGNAHASTIQQDAVHGRAATVAVLLKANADPNARDSRGLTPLHWASTPRFAGDDEPPGVSVYEVLLQAGADPNSQSRGGRTPLHMAAATGYSERVDLLSKAGANPNVRDEYGVTPFHLAAGCCDSDLVSALLASGADPMARDGYDRTPLHRAAGDNYRSEVIAVLLANGAHPDALDKDGRTPLHYAAWEGRPEVIEELFGADPVPNAQSVDGDTPLHSAAIDRGVVVIAMLLKAGADRAIFCFHRLNGSMAVVVILLNPI